MNIAFSRLIGTLVLLASTAAQAACPSVATATRFELNGAEVKDKITNLVWARCSVGQTWSGSTCTGSASILAHEPALQHAKDQTVWRLPNVKELASLADKGCISAAIDRTAFPATPASDFWSASSILEFASSVWVVNFNNGAVTSGGGRTGSAYHVRLVRASQ